MNPTYVNNIPLMQGEVTVIMSDSVTDSVRYSAELAKAIREDGVNALLLNCGMSEQQFYHIANPIVREHGKGANRVEMRSVVRGNVACEIDRIEHIINDSKIAVLIINSWEWASSSWRRKNDLLFALRGLMEDTKIAVIVYSISPTKPVPRMPDRGGIGKLAELALYIVHLSEANALKDRVKRPKPIVVNGRDRVAMEKSAQLIREKLKSYSEDREEVTAKGQSGSHSMSERMAMS